MYSLYYDKSKKKIEIAPVKQNTFMAAQITDKVTFYNNCYYICSDRKLLKEKAVEIRNSWIEETEKELAALKEMTIKNKY